MGRPWHSGELAPEPAERIGELAAGEILAEWWQQQREPALPWPGLAPAREPGPDPDRFAASIVTRPGTIPTLTGFGDPPYLGLARGADGAAAITSCGWLSRAGGLAETAAIIRSWQDRFGARVCSLGMDTLGLSIAWPPTTLEHARRVAAEHFAFCIDLAGMTTLDKHAQALTGAHAWHFWWD